MPSVLLAALFLASLTRGCAAQNVVNVELSEFVWSFDAEDNTTSLTVCSPDPLLDSSAVIGVVLNVQALDASTQKDFNGKLLDDFCAAFNVSGLVRLPQSGAVYSVLITALVDGEQVLAMGNAAFALEVDTATINCSGKLLTRAIAPLTVSFVDCLNDLSQFGNVCYPAGDFSSSALCFELLDSDPQGLRVCLEGSSPTPPLTDDGLLSISFLQYSSNSPTDATVSLMVTGATPSSETVFWVDGVVQNVSFFSDGQWNATSFPPRFAEYTVCVVDADQDGQPLTSSSATVTDLAVRVATSGIRDDDDVLLEFGFTNANPRSTYRVSVWGALPAGGAPLEADPLDCSDVEHNSTCFRFMEYSGVADDVFVGIEYADSVGEALGNMVLVPFTVGRPANETRAEEGYTDPW